MSETVISIDGKYHGPAIGFGCWMQSRERVPVGTVRCVRGVLFFAYLVSEVGTLLRPWPQYRVSWAPVEDAINLPENWRHFWERVLAGESRVSGFPKRREDVPATQVTETKTK